MSFDVNLLERHCVATNGYLRLLSPDNIRVPFRGTLAYESKRLRVHTFVYIRECIVVFVAVSSRLESSIRPRKDIPGNFSTFMSITRTCGEYRVTVPCPKFSTVSCTFDKWNNN